MSFCRSQNWDWVNHTRRRSSPFPHHMETTWFSSCEHIEASPSDCFDRPNHPLRIFLRWSEKKKKPSGKIQWRSKKRNMFPSLEVHMVDLIPISRLSIQSFLSQDPLVLHSLCQSFSTLPIGQPTRGYQSAESCLFGS